MSEYNKKLRQKIFDRDKWTCRVCGKQAQHTHHIIYRRNGNNSEKNLIALCGVCHSRVHKNDKKWRDILISMQEDIYGRIDIQDLKKKDKYENFKYKR